MRTAAGPSPVIPRATHLALWRDIGGSTGLEVSCCCLAAQSSALPPLFCKHTTNTPPFLLNHVRSTGARAHARACAIDMRARILRDGRLRLYEIQRLGHTTVEVVNTFTRSVIAFKQV